MESVDYEVCQRSVPAGGIDSSTRSVDKPRPSRNDNTPEFRQTGDQLVVRAERIYRMRRRRAEIFGDATLFGEPAYDLLLDLFIAAGRQRSVAVSSGCVAADVPATTALRAIKLLEERDLVVRRADPCDGRRYFLELTPRATTALETYLSS